MNVRTPLRPLALAALVALALPVARAQNADQPSTDRASREAFAQRYVQRLQERLALTPQQSDVVERALGQRDPGGLWAAAAELAPTLSDDQRARLTAPPPRPDRATEADRPGRMHRGDRRDHAGRANSDDRTGRERNAERPDRPDRSGAFEAMKQARNAALGLSADQAAALDQLEAQHRQARQERRARRDQAQGDDAGRNAPPRMERRSEGPIPQEVAEILTDEQETIWLVHQALTPHFHGRPGGPGRDGRN